MSKSSPAPWPGPRRDRADEVYAVQVLSWDLRIPGCRSLKEKRTVVRSLRDRLTHRFKVSAAETDYQNEPDRAQLTVALVASDGRLAESLADKIDRYVADTAGAVVVTGRRERI